MRRFSALFAYVCTDEPDYQPSGPVLQGGHRPGWLLGPGGGEGGLSGNSLTCKQTRKHLVLFAHFAITLGGVFVLRFSVLGEGSRFSYFNVGGAQI